MVKSKSEVFGEVMRNEKRIFILKVLMENRELSWSQLANMLEERFGRRMNPNTISFHLKYLLDRNMVRKTGDVYQIMDTEGAKLILEMVK